MWDTHRDRVVYVDPLPTRPNCPDQAWVDAGVGICPQIWNAWSVHELPGPSYGFELPMRPQQQDGVSCGLCIIVHMLMIINGWVEVLFL